MKPPKVKKTSTLVEHHGVSVPDPYRWLHDKEATEVRAHLEAENAYAAAVLEPQADFIDRLYDEMLDRIVEDDRSVPAKEGPFLYFHRTETGRAYPIYHRTPIDRPEEEHVVLDVNELAEGHDYTGFGAYETSPSHRLLAYSVDHEGNERYTLRIKDLTTGEDLEDVIEDTSDDVAWIDEDAFLYVVVDDQERPYRVLEHRLGQPVDSDRIVFEEPDDAFYVGIGRTRNQARIIIGVDSAMTSEVWLIDVADPQRPPRVVRPRESGVEYDVDDAKDRLLIRTNLEASEFRLMEAPVETPELWTEVVPARAGITLDGFSVFKDHIVLWTRSNGLPGVEVMRRADGAVHAISFDEAVYDVWPTGNLEYEAGILRFGYTSPVTPYSVFDYDLEAKTRVHLKQIAVPGYDSTQYVAERLWAVASDDTRVPLSLVRRTDTPKDGTAFGLLLGYGAYGESYDPGFDSDLLSLLDRGFVVAIAHVRGGGELGIRWKDDGKLAHKVNSFTDFIACAEHLVETSYTAHDRLVIEGGSAGGLLVGAVLNRRPDLCRVALAQVPFVDPLHTLLDETLPLTVTEWEEWGNPAEPDAFQTILGYSPYDNVHSAPYPHMFVTAGLNDPRVPYWEAAKWVARLRAHQTEDRIIALETEMGAGHGGKSGRYARLRDQAKMYAFILARLGAV